MQFAHEIQRIFWGTLITLIIISLSASYWAIQGKDTILLRDDNPRLFEAIAQIQRGSIYDHNHEALAQTITQNGTTTRQYLHESAYSVLGYYSLRYGEGGVESAFDDILNGTVTTESLSDYFEQSILKIPPTGADIHLTLDLDIQNTLVNEMGDNSGAGIVINAQSGDILALASLPTFDPNTLDEDWDSLANEVGNPFFNRALQGQYQLGGVMYSLWMSHAQLSHYDASERIPNAQDTVALGNETFVSCVLTPPTNDLSLTEGYAYGCPVPFAVYSRGTSSRTYDDLVENFLLDSPLVLDGFPMPEPISTPSDITAEIDTNLLALRNALGQGDITTTPLHVASIMSAIANNGNAPHPRMLQSIREPESDTWQTVTNTTQPSIPMMTAITARQLQQILRTNWQSIQSDTYPDTVSVGASVATSQSGDETQYWITGFVRDEQRNHIAFVVLLEDLDDVQSIITAGQHLIDSIINEIMPAS
jgi:peptidoglycan glycosyltransferase